MIRSNTLRFSILVAFFNDPSDDLGLRIAMANRRYHKGPQAPKHTLHPEVEKKGGWFKCWCCLTLSAQARHRNHQKNMLSRSFTNLARAVRVPSLSMRPLVSLRLMSTAIPRDLHIKQVLESKLDTEVVEVEDQSGKRLNFLFIFHYFFSSSFSSIVGQLLDTYPPWLERSDDLTRLLTPNIH